MVEKSNVPYDTITKTSVSTKSIITKCCCCIPLRLGCLILGYVHLIFNTFLTFLFLMSLTGIGVMTNGFRQFNLIRSRYEDNSSEKNWENLMIKTVAIILLFLIIINVIWLIMNIACLVGLHKKRPGPIRVYVGFSTARLILGLAYLIFQIAIGWGTEYTVLFGFELGVTAYFIYVYYIYAVQLKKEQQAAAVDSAPTPNVFVIPTKIEKEYCGFGHQKYFK